MTLLQVISPAKINLFLRVTGKRLDGHHELISLMAPIGITDGISLAIDECEGIQVQCQYPGVPCDHTNLASRAAVLFLEQYRKKNGSCSVRGVNIHIEKQIPPGGGLGGGSSNAASVLLALNRYFSFAFSLGQLAEMGMSLGADVPFFLYESAAVITGAGEKVTKISCPLPDSCLLVLHPSVTASTARVFEKYDFCLTKEEEYYTVTDPDSLVDFLNCLSEKDMGNDLEDAAFALYPQIKTARDQMQKSVQKSVHMSGSGSCLFCLYPSYEEAMGDYQKLEKVFDNQKLHFFLTSFYK